MEKLDPKAMWLMFFRFLAAGFIIFVIFFAITFLAIDAAYLFGPWIMLVVFFVWIIITFLWSKLYYSSYKFEFAEKNFKKEYGVITKRYVSIPYERIQNIDIRRGILARILGLSDVMIQTAGYSSPIYIGRHAAIGREEAEGKLIGVSKKRAEEIREFLINKTSNTSPGL
ncbi:MAG: PH domain-containing protein [Candidatus Portnoybacteria bacterium]|nr:PH domain-containing protein [Candidatus Portnoybacteria bacterium]